jgi:hypothetical protein
MIGPDDDFFLLSCMRSSLKKSGSPELTDGESLAQAAGIEGSWLSGGLRLAHSLRL